LRVPSYRRHKPSGQAVVTLNGKDFYLGKWGTKARRTEYDRLIQEWLVAGRHLPSSEASDLTVAELALRYWKFAKSYYRKNGRPTSELDEYRLSLRPLRELYASTSARDFGPLGFKAVRQTMVDAGVSRGVVNHRMARIRRVFKWAVAEELVSPSVYQGLAAVEGLRKGRTTAREPEPIEPVADDVVEATLPHLPEVVTDMVRFQRYTGCRPAEVCVVRPCDVDTSGDVWIYRPESHKTEHHGRERVICIGPRAQDVLRPYLLRAADSFCFSPTDSERKRLSARHEARKTPLRYGNRPGTNRKRKPKRKAGEHYTTNTYRRAIHRAVDLENRKRREEAKQNGHNEADVELVPKWSPNRLRHSAATEIRRRFGLEAAQVTLGHATADVSQIYAERDLSLAAEVMRKIG
jgi:integrase